MYDHYHAHVDSLVEVLHAVKHDVNSGMLTNFRSLIQAEIFADFLTMTEHLLGEGYKDAAAVLLGAILEDSLRKIAEANGIGILNPKGKPVTIDPLNTGLAKKGAYNALVQKQVIKRPIIVAME